MRTPTPDDLVQLIKGLVARGRSEEAESILQQIGAGDQEVRIATGRSWLALNQTQRAAECFRAALPHPVAESELGFLAQSEGDFSAASQHFLSSIGLQPDQGSAYQGWTQCNRIRDTHADMVRGMEAVRNRVEGRERMALHYALGKACADLGRDQEAVDAYDEANRLAKSLQRPATFDRKGYAAATTELIEKFTPAFLQKHATWGSPRKLPLIVTGMMRSGTTLVEQILTNHPQVGTAGEVEYIVETGPQVMSSWTKASVTNLADDYTRLLRTVAQTAQHPSIERVVDKSPMNVPFLGLIHLAFPKAKIVALRRDGLDTCWSIYTNAYSVSPAFAHDQGDIAFAWKQNERLLDHWRLVLPPSVYHEVTYESLVTQPETVIKNLARHCGLTWDESLLHPESNQGRITTSSVFQARQPINAASIKRSHRYLPWLREFKELAR